MLTLKLANKSVFKVVALGVFTPIHIQVNQQRKKEFWEMFSLHLGTPKHSVDGKATVYISIQQMLDAVVRTQTFYSGILV